MGVIVVVFVKVTENDFFLSIEGHLSFGKHFRNNVSLNTIEVKVFLFIIVYRG